eukprot:TRINITY_DN6218_c0_g3_i2.p1 TRINITY_DN6218_c0_g3~~TRINITY_DN6218_c0_g3_i2.p1  ORF type:complete len:273 (-),score=36.58 TRINITY_DN6218_c0_g3_i2:52-870(-)
MEPSPTVPLKDYKGKSFLAIVAWSCILCFNGGFVNGISVAGVFRLGLTHMTGLTTKSASVLLIWPSPGQMPVGGYFGFIFGFLFGAFVVGAIIGAPQMRWGILQAFCMLLEAIALWIGWHFSPHPFGGACLSFSMGVQNCISSNFTGGALRTSHVSGTVLDIGLGLGQCLRLRNLQHFWKVQIHTPNYICFWLGSLAGTAVYNSHDKDAYVLSALFATIVSLWTLIHAAIDYLYDLMQRKAAGGSSVRLFDNDSTTTTTTPTPGLDSSPLKT